MKLNKQSICLSLLGLVGGALIANGKEPVAVTSKFDVSLYGYVKVDAAYDTHRTASGNLMLFVLPYGEEGKKDEFNLTARETRLGMDIKVPDLPDWSVSGKVEMDFYGGGTENSPNPRLRLGYLDVARGRTAIRAGQDWDTFITILPRVVNFSFLADAGALGLRRPQVRVTHTVPLAGETTLTAKLGVSRTIGQDIDGGGQNDGAAAGYPTLQANLAIETPGLAGRRMIASLSGHAGTERVCAHIDDSGPEPVTVPKKDYDTWSAIGSILFPLTSRIHLQGSIWRGENLDTYFGGIGQGINPRARTGIAAQGGWAQAVYRATDKLHLHAGYGLDDPDSDDLNPDDRSRNELWFGSAFYTLGHGVTVAAEYSHMTTSYKDNAAARNNRIHLAMIYQF